VSKTNTAKWKSKSNVASSVRITAHPRIVVCCWATVHVSPETNKDRRIRITIGTLPFPTEITITTKANATAIANTIRKNDRQLIGICFFV
jgi:hypothetical protein